MKFVKEAGIICGISAIGEMLNHLLPLPVPAGVYGLFLLLFFLIAGIVKLKDLEVTGNWLLDTMPIMFLPSCVGMMENLEMMKEMLIPLLVISIVSTVTVFGATGSVAQWMMKRKGERKK